MSESNHSNGKMEVHAYPTEQDIVASRNIGPVLAISFLSIITVAFVCFLFYMFCLRDTWEIDNYAQIIERCNTVHLAITEDQYDKASKAYDELLQFIGNRKIKREYIAERVDKTRQAFAPIQIKLEQSRRKKEFQELAQKKTSDSDSHAAINNSSYRLGSNENNMFYDPNREYPYMANDISFHRTKEEAIQALALQFDHSAEWVKKNMGSSNYVTQIHRSLCSALISESGYPKTSQHESRLGSVNYSLVNTIKNSWQQEKFRYKSVEDQAKAMAVIVLAVNTDCKDPKDREATLDYIQSHIGSW